MIQQKYPEYPIFLIDDEPVVLENYDYALYSAGLNNFVTISNSCEVMSKIEEIPCQVMVLDLMMPDVSGCDLLQQIKEKHPQIPIIVVTAVDDVKTVVTCMKMGAFDYLVKPIDNDLFLATIKHAIEQREHLKEIHFLKKCIFSDNLKQTDTFNKIITHNKNMTAIFRYVTGIAPTSFPVLITGETGVGKELIAEAIHHISGKKGSFVPVNSGGLDNQILADTLFGHKKGAFTGADKDRPGLIASAAGGSLFLDEIGELGESAQIKLLRFLQNKTFYPLGSDKEHFSDVRIIAATNYSLNQLKKNATFRKDLYYRLQTHSIEIPPLRKRQDDIPVLTDYFISQAAEHLGKRKPPIPSELYQLLNTYQFPGNIRELQSMIYDAVSIYHHGRLSLEPFRKRIDKEYQGALDTINPENNAENNRYMTFHDTLPPLKEIENLVINEALQRTKGNQTQAAQLLGVSRKALSSRLVRMKNEYPKTGYGQPIV